MCNQVLESSVRPDDYKWFIFIFQNEHLSILNLFLVVYLYLSILVFWENKVQSCTSHDFCDLKVHYATFLQAVNKQKTEFLIQKQ